MNLIIFAALIAAGGAAKLDRSYLPPASAATAGGSAGNLQLPFSRSNQVSQEVPAGGFVNDHQGVVVDAATVVAGARVSNQQSGLGGPRISYGSTESKVGDAAFRVTAQNQEFLNEFGEPDLSAFYKPPSSSSSSGNLQVIRDPSHTVNYHNVIDIDKFNYGFETNNGIKVAQNGIDSNGVQSQGSYSYIGDDGKQYSVSYTADENGYRPQGSHLPTPPPIPREILLALERNAKDEAAGIIDDGSYDARKYNAEGDYKKNEAKYNDRQSNKFGNRPTFDSGFINQKQAFVRPNLNGQFGYNTVSKDSMFSKPDSFGFGSSFMQSDSRLGSNNKPSNMDVNFYNNLKEKENQSPVASINIMGLNNSPRPLSQQNLQAQSFQKPSFVRPSSYDVSNNGLSVSSQSSSLPSSNSLNHEFVNKFGNGNIVSSFGQTYENNPSQGPLLNQQILTNQQSLNNKKPYFQNALNAPFTTSQPSTGYFGSQVSQQFPSSHKNDHLSETIASFSSSSQNIGHSQSSNKFSSSFPTTQPQIILTTPLESLGTGNITKFSTETESIKIDDLDTTKMPEMSPNRKEIQAFPGQLTTNGDFSASYTGTYTSSQADTASSQNYGSQSTQVFENNKQTTQASYSLNQPSSASFLFNTQKPSYEGSSFVQPQAPDHSYLYNPPLKPFKTPSTRPGFNLPVPSSQIDKVTPSLKPETSIFTNTPQTAILTTLNQGIGVTQAAISPFPATIPVASSDFKQTTQSNSRPLQIASLNTPSASAFSQIIPTSSPVTTQTSTFPELQPQDEKSNTPTQQYSGELYQYTKPTETLPTESQDQNEVTQKQKEQSGLSTVQLFNLQTLTTPFANQDTTTNIFATSQLGEQPNFPSSHQSSTLHSDKTQIDMQVGSQFSNGVFNNKGSSFPSLNQDATIQPNFKPISSIPGKFPNLQLDQQNFASYSFKPEGQLIQSKPQFEQGNIGENQQSIQNSQTTSDNFSSQNLVSQIGQQSFSSPTKEPVFQANTEAQLNEFNTQTFQYNTIENTQINKNKEGAISHHIETQSNFKPSMYLPPPFQAQSAGFNNQKPITEFGQSISSLPSTQFENQQGTTTFGSGVLNNKETTIAQFQQPSQQFENRFGNNPSTPISSSSQTQYSSFNTQSTTPQFSQPTTSNSGDLLTNTEFGQYSNSKTTTPKFEISQQSTTSFNEPSTIPTSTSETQTTIQSSNFGEIYDYNKPVQGFISSSKNEDISQTKPQFGAQSTTQFGQQDLFSTQKLGPSQFVQPVGSTVQFGESTVTNSDQLSTSIPLQSTQLNTEFGQYSNSKSTTSQFEIGQQSTTSLNEPSTIPPNTLETQPSSQISEFGEIYNYKKPTQGFIPSSQKEDNSQITPQFQIDPQSSTQFDQKDLYSSQKVTPSQYTQPASTVQFGENTMSTSGFLSSNTPLQSTQLNSKFGEYSISKITTSEYKIGQQSTTSFNEPSTIPPSTSEIQTSTPSSETGEIYDYKKPAQGFISPSQKQENPQIKPHSQFGAQSGTQFGQQALSSVQTQRPSQTMSTFTSFPVSQLSISSFNDRDTATGNIDNTESVTSEKNLSTQEMQYTSSYSSEESSKGDIYEYQTPEQGLSTPADKVENMQFDQKIQKPIGSSTSNKESFESIQQTTSNLVESTTTFKPFNQETTEKSFESRPQLSIHRACCGSSLFNKKPLSQNKLEISTNSFDQNKDSKSQEGIRTEQSSDNKKLESPQGSNFAGIPEQFGGPRKPPSFDENGYHY